MLAAARRRATELGKSATIVIVDPAADPRALFRAEDADWLTIALATGKARLAASNGLPTKAWRDLTTADRHLAHTIPVTLDRALGGAVLYAGGYPVVVDGSVAGAIGVSGGSEDSDDDVARAGLAAVQPDAG